MIIHAMMFKLQSQAAHIGDDARGYALLLAILITSAVLAGATALASIVLSEIKQTRDISNAIEARVMAESDIEQALFVLRKGGEDVLQRAPEHTGIEREVEARSPARPFVISENDFVSLPVPSDFTGNITISAWGVAADCASSSWIEVSSITWDSGFSTDRHPYSLASDTPILFPVDPDTVEIRIRALYCDITSLEIVDLPSRISITSTAEVQNARQTVEVIIPRTIPAAGLFDFVIFSECGILKGVEGNPVICP